MICAQLQAELNVRCADIFSFWEALPQSSHRGFSLDPAGGYALMLELFPLPTISGPFPANKTFW